MTRAAKVTTFYKIGAFQGFSAAIFGSGEVGFQGRRDGHFFARDGHYVSNDHREQKNDGFRVAGKLPFSPPPPPRRAHRQTTEALKALARCRNGRNVYLYILRKTLTMAGRGLNTKSPCRMSAGAIIYIRYARGAKARSPIDISTGVQGRAAPWSAGARCA